MSYILDALRKADEERERGTVPSVHAQPSFGGGAVAESAPRGRPWGLIGGGVVAALLLVGATWYLTSGRNAADLPARSLASAAPAAMTAPVPGLAPAPATAPKATAVPLPAPTPAPPTVAATTSTGAPPAPAPAPAIAPPAATGAPAPLPLEPIRRTTPAPKPAAEKKPAAAPVDATGAVANPPDTTTAANIAAKPPVEATAARLYRLDQLPPDVRRQLPTLSIAGARYSPTPAERILIVNGQVLHEGDKITPDVVLQQIKPKGAVLQFRDYRYEISF